MATKARHLKTPLQLWVADCRKAGGYSSADLAAWTGVTTDTARGWESRGRPSEDAIAILERKFGKAAPRDAPDAPPADQSELVAALAAQTAAITALVQRLDRLLDPATSPARIDDDLGPAIAAVRASARAEMAQEPEDGPTSEVTESSRR